MGTQPASLNRFQCTYIYYIYIYIYIYITYKYGKINGDHHHLSTVQNNEDLKPPASFVKQPGCAFEKISNKHSEFETKAGCS